MEKTYIYGLFNDLTNELVYVGSTVDLKSRLSTHLCTTAKSFRPHCRIEVLETTYFRRLELEAYWINAMLALGCNLKNKHRKELDYCNYLRGIGDVEERCRIQYEEGRALRRERERKRELTNLKNRIARQLKGKIHNIMLGDGAGI